MNEPDELIIRRQICADPAQQAAQLRKGLTPEDWLDDGDQAADPWLLRSTRFNAINQRDAYIANGWIGQRVAPRGDGDYRHGSRSFCYSCRDHRNGKPGGIIRELPRWATLDCREVVDRLFRQCEERSDYLQTVDLHKATVTTSCQRTTPGAQWHEERCIWLARHDKHLAVLSATLTPEWGDTFAWHEELVSDDAEHTITTEEVDGCLVLSLREGDKRICIASKLLTPPDIHGKIVSNSTVFNGIERRWQATLERGKAVTVHKVVAIVTSDESADPQQDALNRLAAFNSAQDVDASYQAHCAAWEKLWEHRVEVDHPRLQQIINASTFQLYASMRDDITWSIPPCGLSGHGWGGKIFWDSESWMFPPINLLQPEIARSMADYRIDTLGGARQNAADEGQNGASYGWTTAESGIENSSKDGPYWRERHISCCVVLALWQHFLTTHDEKWLASAWPVFQDVAAYWAGYVEKEGAQYHIRQVCCADEYAKIQDDNAYTNAAVARCFRLAHQVAAIVNQEADPHWLEIADHMYLPFDEGEQVYLEYEGFTPDTTIKQADATLMVYPWAKITDPAMMRRMRDYYRPKYSEYLIMMAEAIDGIISCRLGEAEDAWDILRGLMPFYRQPFFGTTESPWNEVMVFCTGLGGFMQLILNGFAGIQLADDELQIMPALPSALSRLVVHGLHHRGRNFRLEITNNSHELIPL